ncbi:HNH endonuclease, partial [Actinomadura alba]
MTATKVDELPDLSSGRLPGPALAGELAELPLGGLDEHALVEAMRAARRLTSWAESLELSAIAELDRRRQARADRCGAWTTVEMSRALCDEISAALTLSGTAAAIQLGLASMLEGPLLETGRALTEGRIDSRKARAICDGVLGIGHDIARKVEALVLPDAPRLTARQLAIRVRNAIKDADPDAYERRRKAAEKGRRVELYDNPDGTADLTARDLPAEDADAAYNYLNALANALKADGDQRPIDTIRTDVLLELLRGRHPADLSPAPADPDPEQGPPPPAEATPKARDSRPADSRPGDAEPEDTAPGDAEPPAAAPRGAESEAAGEPAAVAAETVASQRAIGRPGRTRWTDSVRPGQTDGDTGREDATGRGEATRREEATGREEAAAIARAARDELTDLLDQIRDQGGPAERRLLITEAAHRIKDAISPLKIRWCTLAIDTGGNPVHGHHGYRPPAAMRRLIQTRDRTCAFPTCNHRATKCDLDHTIPYHKGGPTCPCNVAAL